MGSQYTQEDIDAFKAQEEAEVQRILLAKAKFQRLMRWRFLWAPIVLLKYFWGVWRRHRGVVLMRPGKDVYVFSVTGKSVETIRIPAGYQGVMRFPRTYSRSSHFLVAGSRGVVAHIEDGCVVVHSS